MDFEGIASSLSTNFVTFMSELRSGLNSRAPGQSYLTVDTCASAGLGGTMYNLPALAPNIDAFDLMGYGFASSSQAGPTAPMNGDWYNVTRAVSDYQSRFGIPASEIILGVPYYGYKWSVGSPTPQANALPGTHDAADTYSGALADFRCAEQLQLHWDNVFLEPWATWWSPASGDPCGGNHNSWRELYYETAQSLGYKYDLVNNAGLRGIGIWALGYDSGSSDLWNEIVFKFTVTHGPSVTVSPLPAAETTTAFTVAWTSSAGSPSVSRYVLWVRDGAGVWLKDTTTPASSTTFNGFAGHSYGFFVEAVGTNGYDSGRPTSGVRPQATTTISGAASRVLPFVSMYGVDAYGALQPGSSPPLAGTPALPADLARGITLDNAGAGGVVLDGWGGLHAFGDAASASGYPYWPGWDIAVGVGLNSNGQGGYVLDGWGGIHPFALGAGATPPSAVGYPYWPGWKNSPQCGAILRR